MLRSFVVRVSWLGALSVLLACACSSDDTPGKANSKGGGGTTASGGAGTGATSNGGGSGTGTGGASGTGTGGASAGAGGTTSGGSGGTGGSAGSGGSAGTASTYDQTVLADGPVAFWAMNQAPADEPDLTGHGHTGTYHGAPPPTTLPNGDTAAAFDGATQYLGVPSSAAFSIPTTGSLCFEAWIRPDVLQFPNDEGSGYVDWMGKCEQFSPTCEWEARLYDTNTQESPNRPNRFSAYVFNPTAGLGSGADWQPAAGVVQAGTWYHVVGQYTTQSQPSDCLNTSQYPGSIDIWVDAIQWDHSSHGQTGCMSQYQVVPQANGSALDIGTMTTDSFFQGAIGKVAIYDHLLDKAQIENHYVVMTGKQPSGSCAATCSL